MLGDQKWHDRVDRVVERAADRISKELEKMVGALRQDAAPQMAMEAKLEPIRPRSRQWNWQWRLRCALRRRRDRRCGY